MADTELLLLVSILAQAFFTLVRSHFMSFTFFTAGHNIKILGLFLLYCSHENLCRFECGNIVGGDSQSGLLGDVAGGFLSSVLDDKAAKATKIHGLSGDTFPAHCSSKKSNTPRRPRTHCRALKLNNAAI